MATIVTRAMILGSHNFYISRRKHAQVSQVTCMIRATVYRPTFISGGHENWPSPQYQAECATRLFSYAALNCRNALVHVFHILVTQHEHFDTESHPVIITIDTAPTLTFDLRAVIRPDSGT